MAAIREPGPKQKKGKDPGEEEERKPLFTTISYKKKIGGDSFRAEKDKRASSGHFPAAQKFTLAGGRMNWRASKNPKVSCAGRRTAGRAVARPAVWARGCTAHF